MALNRIEDLAGTGWWSPNGLPIFVCACPQLYKGNRSLLTPAIDQPLPIEPFAGPKAARKSYALRLLFACPVEVETRRRAPPCDPDSAVPVRPIGRDPTI